MYYRFLECQRLNLYSFQTVSKEYRQERSKTVERPRELAEIGLAVGGIVSYKVYLTSRKAKLKCLNVCSVYYNIDLKCIVLHTPTIL